MKKPAPMHIRILLFIAWPLLAPALLVVIAALLCGIWPIILTDKMTLGDTDENPS